MHFLQRLNILWLKETVLIIYHIQNTTPYTTGKPQPWDQCIDEKEKKKP